jgi:hypothetical protein
MAYFIIDSIRYDMPCSIEREAEIRASDISGMLLDKGYFNDVIGTYMRYTVSVAVPTGQESDYAQLYEILTDPKASHTCDLPYNQGRKIIVGRIEAVSDKYYHEEDGVHIWRGTKFTITANEPSKVNEL